MKQATFVYRTTLDPSDTSACVHNELGSIVIHECEQTIVRCTSRWRPSTLIIKPFHTVLEKITSGTNKLLSLLMDHIRLDQNA